jgi:hypothetical protein
MLCNGVRARQTPVPMACVAWDDRRVARAKKKKLKRDDDPLAPYRKLRTPMPPPEKVIPDRRRELEDEQALREIDEAAERSRRREIEEEQARGAKEES